MDHSFSEQQILDHLDEGRYADALVAVQAPAEFIDSFLIGRVYYANGMVEEALAEFAKCPVDEAVARRKGDCLFKLGRWREALDVYSSAFTDSIRDKDTWWSCASCYMELGEIEQARKCYIKATHIDPHDADLQYNIGNCYLDEGKNENAVDCFERASALGLTSYELLFNMSKAYEEMNLYSLAIETAEKARALRPRCLNALKLLVRCLVLSDKKKALKNLIDRHPHEAQAKYLKKYSREVRRIKGEGRKRAIDTRTKGKCFGPPRVEDKRDD